MMLVEEAAQDEKLVVALGSSPNNYPMAFEHFHKGFPLIPVTIIVYTFV